MRSTHALAGALPGALIGAAALTLGAAGASGATILNGDLAGPVGAGIVPPDWFPWQKTPDTCDALGPFNNTITPWTASPNGHTFVRAGGSDFANSEAIAQNVTGFTPGAPYVLEFFLTNLGFENASSGAWGGQDGYWELYLDGTLAGSSVTLSRQATAADPIVWSSDTIGFVAPAANFELALVSRTAGASGLAAYMGIDGVGVRLVPAPGALAALAGAGLGAFARRRRRG